MREVKSEEDLEIGTLLAWDNKGTHREAIFGDYTIIEKVGECENERIVENCCGKFRFPDAEVPQLLSFYNVRTNCMIIDPEEDPEWLI